MTLASPPPGAADDAPHLLVVDDDARLRALLRRFLGENGYRVTLAGDAAEARRHVASVAFDLLILDVMMPGESGLDLVSGLRERLGVPILLLTARGEAADRIAGLERGADDYLAKPFEPRELLLRVAAILRRARTVVTAGVQATGPLRLGRWTFEPGPGLLHDGPAHLTLTTAEVQLMRILAEIPGATVPREVLAGRLDMGQERSVDVLVTRLRRKLEVDPRHPRYLQTVRGRGYALWPD